MLKITVVEDEDAIRRFIRINLERRGWDVKDYSTAELAMDDAIHEFPDIFLLDIMLPGMSGLDMARWIRHRSSDVGIIMLTAKSQDTDKIEGLECGADDYITKPFNPTELILRVQSLARRLQIAPTEEILENPPFMLDVTKRRLTKNGQYIELTPTEFAIMELFMRSPGKACSRDEILNTVWGSDFLGDSKIVDVNIRRIRAKIEEQNGEDKYIQTIWGIGYRFK